MTRDEFIKQAIASGKPKEAIRKVYDTIEAKGGFDDNSQPPQPPVSKSAPEQEQPRSQTTNNGISGALFPATTKATNRGGNFVNRTIAGMGDALTLPARGAAAAATGLGTLYGGGKWSDAGKLALNELGKTESDESGALGFAQNMALDPTSSPLLLGAGMGAKGAGAAIKAVPKIGKALLMAGAAGAADAGASALYQQSMDGEISVPQTIGQAALGFGVGAAGAGLGKAIKKGTGELLKNSAIRNIDIQLRPGQYGRKIGYDHSNVVKHELVGTPRETFEKATAKLNELQNNAKKIAATSEESFNIEKWFDDEISSLSPKNKPKEYSKKLKELIETKDAYVGAHGSNVDAATAMKIRTEIGEESAFVGRTSGGTKVDPDANWKEDLYSNFYMRIKNDLHKKLGGELKVINNAQHEIIPIKQVAERRIPIAESNYRIGLTDLLTTGVGAGAGFGYGAASGDGGFEGALKGLAIGAGAAGARRALGSPTATKAMYKLGAALTKTKDIIPTKYANEIDRSVDLPSDWNIPAYQRKGVSVEPGDVGLYPLEGKVHANYDRKALPAPMLGKMDQTIKKQIPTMGQRLNKLGTDIEVFEQPGSGAPVRIPAKLMSYVQDIGTLNQVLKMMDNIPKDKLTNDQYERVEDVIKYLTTHKKGDVLRVKGYRKKGKTKIGDALNNKKGAK